MEFLLASIRKFVILGAIFLLILPVAQAQEVHQEFQETVKAEVLEVTAEYERDIMGTGASTTVQELRIQLKEGERVGEVVRLENDLAILREGDSIYVNRLVSIDGSEYFTFKDVERKGPLVVLVFIFIALIIWLSGKQGVRALFSLAISIIAIIFVLIPALLAGYSPALSSLVIAGFILSFTLFFTHGLKPRVFITFLGTFGAVMVTCLMAWIWVEWMRFTGFSDDAAVYLNFATDGTLDLTGLLLGSIIIGLLGVLDDVSITQASVVQQLKGANHNLGFKELYSSAIKVGRDHVGSLVNTLAFAYVGAALPLILLYSLSESSILITLNQEVIAAEILRIVVGSIGLVLAVPLTTTLAAWYFKDKCIDEDGLHTCADHHQHSH
ncbi:MAG: YibE/F family protein [Candidatus Nomurabacteria bacterium]|nr:YibE/F family protein [Candidatus Nomurabacteria bacterium]USN88232.1 MAG: YibE/F family protein [Candidatus Nomurabacteria bacterium]